MYQPVYTKQFKKDMKRGQRQNRNIEQFKLIARGLLAGQILDPIFRDHKLTGNYKGRRECHVESDWLLIYKKDEDRIIFERIGSHSELFSE
jgi:mRNA interferase YafQ